jgi:hypothetical protein
MIVITIKKVLKNLKLAKSNATIILEVLQKFNFKHDHFHIHGYSNGEIFQGKFSHA